MREHTTCVYYLTTVHSRGRLHGASRRTEWFLNVNHRIRHQLGGKYYLYIYKKSPRVQNVYDDYCKHHDIIIYDLYRVAGAYATTAAAVVCTQRYIMEVPVYYILTKYVINNVYIHLKPITYRYSSVSITFHHGYFDQWGNNWNN